MCFKTVMLSSFKRVYKSIYWVWKSDLQFNLLFDDKVYRILKDILVFEQERKVFRFMKLKIMYRKEADVIEEFPQRLKCLKTFQVI